MNHLIKTISVMLLCTTSLYASTSQELKLDAQKRLEASISKDNLNRLTVINDRITQVFGDEEAYISQVDESGGQVFIKPSELNGSKPLSLTIITENGQTQDLTLKPFDREASTIILKTSDKGKAVIRESPPTKQGKYEPINSVVDKTLPIQEKLIQVMKMLVTDQLPILDSGVIDSVHDRTCPEGFTIKAKKAYQFVEYKGFVFEITNDANKLIEIEDKSFYRQGDLALSFDKRDLKAGETTKLSVICR